MAGNAVRVFSGVLLVSLSEGWHGQQSGLDEKEGRRGGERVSAESGKNRSQRCMVFDGFCAPLKLAAPSATRMPLNVWYICPKFCGRGVFLRRCSKARVVGYKKREAEAPDGSRGLCAQLLR